MTHRPSGATCGLQVPSRSLVSLFLFLITMLCAPPAPGADQAVLFISSYHPDFPTVHRQIDGIREALGEGAHLDLEFMDSKRFPQPDSKELFRGTLAFKLANSDSYSMVITADDNALLFALEESCSLLLSAYGDRSGLTRSFEHSLELIRGRIAGPIFHLWRHGLGDGVIGGKVICHYEQGLAAGRIARQVLAGAPVAGMRVVESSPNRYMFDYAELARFDVDRSLLPEGRMVSGVPQTFYNDHKNIIWATAGMLAALAGMLAAAIVSIQCRKRVEAEWADREMLLATIIESIPDLVWLKDLSGRYLSCNVKFEKMFGAKMDEIIGRTDYDFVDKGLADFFRQRDTEALEAGEPCFNEEEVVFAFDGHKAHLETVKTPMLDGSGNVIGVLGVAREITQRKEVEEALRKSRNRFAMAMEASRDGLYDWDLVTNEVYYSPGWKRMLGYEDDEIPNKLSSWENLTDPRSVDVVWEMMRGLAYGKARRIEIEFRMRHKDGHWVDILSRGDAVLDDTGQPVRVVGTHVNITECRRANRELEASEEKFSKAFRNSPLMMSISSLADGRYLDVNKAFERSTGYTQDVAVGSTSVEIGLVSSRDRERLKRAVCHDGYVYDVELKLKKADGSPLYCLYSGELISFGDKRRLLSLAIDITERKQVQYRLQQAQKMESIGSLAGGIAHDFNNILSPIVGMSELLLDDLPDGGQQREDVQEILNASRRAADLVRQILAFSRQDEQEFRPVKVQAVLKEALKLSRATIPANIEIAREIDADCGLVMADPVQIHQICMNIITNAHHAMGEEGGTVTVRLAGVEIDGAKVAGSDLAPGRYVLLSISDTGSGMPEGVMAKIFEPYYTTKKRGKGTGMGLAVVYGLVKAHKGEVQVESEEGVGTTFDILLPMMTNDLSTPEEEDGADLPGGTERILFVDDDELIAKTTAQTLDRLGYRVESRMDSLEALKLFRDDPGGFDLVITDMTMPKMTGDQLSREMLNVRPDVPIIVCTGFSEWIDEAGAEALGVADLLMKPAGKREMAESVRKALDGRS